MTITYVTRDGHFRHMCECLRKYCAGMEQRYPRCLTSCRVTQLWKCAQLLLPECLTVSCLAASAYTPQNREICMPAATTIMSAERLRFCLLAYDYLSNHNQPTENVVFSPLSAEIALSMACAGAKGKTRQEIADLLGWKSDTTPPEIYAILERIKKDEVEEITADMLPPGVDLDPNFQPPQYYKLFMANGAFVDKKLILNESYRDGLKNKLDAACFSVQFRTDPDGAVQHINDYIEQHTNSLLRDVLSPMDVTKLTELMLVNTLYFKSNWHYQFSRGRTVKKPFTTATGEKIQVDMMHNTAKCNYYKSKELGGAKFLQMMYSEHICSAIFVLPGKKGLFSRESPDHGLNKLRSLLTPATLFNAVESMYLVNFVDIQLPRFRLEQRMDMEKMLCTLGMPTAFSNTADFSGITECAQLRISKVKQMAYIDVNEKGTEAAAATVVALENCCLPRNTRAKFTANRPFLFFIRHNASNTVLFMGSVVHPNSATS